MKLPEKYTEKMKRLLGEDGLQDYLKALEEPMQKSLRVNTLKISVEDFVKICPFKLSPIPWTKNGFYYESELPASKHPYYYAGLYYLQEPSAMVPASQIPVEAGDKILDTCAAPGGKTTELAARLGGSGYLVSNDISASRAKALIKNIENFGIENVTVTCESLDKLSSHFAGYFDKILIDAPCSGEGMFRKSTSMVTAWERNGNEMFANIQKSILKEAVKMLRPGGVILYSTCTFDPSEDEESVAYLLSLDENLKIKPVTMYEGFEPGHPEWGEGTEEIDDLKYTAHLFPHKVRGEGHYVSMVENTSKEEQRTYTVNYQPKKVKISPEMKEFFSHVLRKFPENRLSLISDRLYYTAEGCPDTAGLRVLKSGLFLGEVKKNRFEPSQSLALVLKKDEFDNVLDLPVEDERVLKYLKCETLDVTEPLKNGWTLVCVDGFPLGFGKLANGTLKNKLLPGWRMALIHP